MRTQIISGHVPYIHAAQGDPAVRHVIEAHQQIDQRGFAAACGSYNRNTLAGLHRQVEVLNQRTIRHILEGNIFKSDDCPIRHFLGMIAFLFRRLIHQLHQPPCRGHSRLQLCHDAGDFVEGLGVLVGIAEEAGQLTYRHAAVHRRQCAGNADRCIHQTINEAGQRVGKRRINLRLIAPHVQTTVDFPQLLFAFFFMTEELDQLLACYHFLHMAAQFALDLALLDEGLMGAPGNQGGNDHRHRGQCHHHQCNKGMDGNHEAQCADNGHHAGKQLGEALQQTVADSIHVADHTVDNIAVCRGVNEAQRYTNQLGKHIDPQVADRFVADRVGAHAHNPLEHSTHCDHNQQQHCRMADGRKIHLILADDLIHRITNQHRAQQTHHHINDGAYQCQQQVAGIGFHKAHEALEHFTVFHACASCMLIWE